MAWFRKKPDLISARARELQQKIAALENQIQQLSTTQREVAQSGSAAPAEPRPPESPPPVTPAPIRPAEPPAPAPTPAAEHGPKLRSTAFPHGPTVSAHASPAEPVFEELDQGRIQENQPPRKPEPPEELGIRKAGLPSWWERLTRHFRGPATSNPKLVNYLAAGSIQGLRPLRYEKRVARNRTFVLVGLLILVLWGIVAIFIRRH